MTALEKIIRERIEDEGPMDVGTFMGLAVDHYYRTRDPLGAAGDFTTAPEISQMFGELLGAWAADRWIGLGRPGKFILLECGPGRGTLMADALRAVRKVAGFTDAAEIVLMETSPVLREKQKKALDGYDVRWIETLDDPVIQASNCPVILLANEFLDALPVEQFEYRNGEWQQRVIIIQDYNLSSSRRKPGSIRTTGQAPWIPAFAGMTEGDVCETSPGREDFVRDVCRLLRPRKGAALFVDYGYDGPASGDTLQAVKNHQYVPVLADIGESDLTAHVDFGALRRVAEEEKVDHELRTQGAFLESLGIRMRAAALTRNATPRQQAEIDTALARLTAPGQMGRLFMAMTLWNI